MREPNIRIISHSRNEKISTYIDPSNKAKLDEFKELLAEYQREEPGSRWHIETRGTQLDWHDWWTELVAITGG